MTLQKATGIVLRRAKRKESDLSVRVLLESGATVEFYLHGIRASRSRSSLIAEPGTLIRADFYGAAEGGGSLKEGDVLDRYDECKNDYPRTLLLSYFLELSELAAKSGPTPEVYRLLVGALNEWRAAARTAPERPEANESNQEQRALFILELLAFFKIRLLRILGLVGDCEHCDVCGADLRDRAGWSVPEVSFRCAKHAEVSSQGEAWMAAVITRSTRVRFQTVREATPTATRENRERLDEWLSRCLEHYFATPSTVAPELYRLLRAGAF